MRETAVLVDTNYRAIFSLSGPDAQRYMNALLTSNVRDLKPGQGAIGLLLTPQGHILAEIETLRLPDSILAISHAMVRERTFSTLEKFIIMDDVTLEDATATLGTLDLIGPRTGELLSEICGLPWSEIPLEEHVEVAIGSIPCRIVHHSLGDIPSAMLIAPLKHLHTLWRILEARVREQAGAAVGMEGVNSVRLEWGLPWFGVDFGDKNIPHEAGLENSHISYEKGCYTGQEIVERVRSRGHANRRLTELKFLAPEPPPDGTKLLIPGTSAGAEVGYVTSTAISPSLGYSIGLGYVRREHSSIGTRLDASGSTAEIISPPFPVSK